ncbi:UNVERIFIED_CONTAM: hypothetical protein Sangu_0062600 [Sesamum angustifolium]|uniref:Uncharacterized protein n=1 Tax=Sesamum angustifolium TaxID=2727405 RepID=A0AAW2RKH7_9LAMI
MMIRISLFLEIDLTSSVTGEALGSIHVNLKVSKQHVEVNLSELKGYEKHVIVELIKEKNQTSDTTLECNEENCKAIVLHEADKLSTDALSYIKWMLEKFKGCNKVFFCCSDAKKLQEIKPLCTYVQLLEPSIEEVASNNFKISAHYTQTFHQLQSFVFDLHNSLASADSPCFVIHSNTRRNTVTS